MRTAFVRVNSPVTVVASQEIKSDERGDDAAAARDDGNDILERERSSRRYSVRKTYSNYQRTR